MGAAGAGRRRAARKAREMRARAHGHDGDIGSVPKQSSVGQMTVRGKALVVAAPVGAPRVQQLGQLAVARPLGGRAHVRLDAVQLARARAARAGREEGEGALELPVAVVTRVRARRRTRVGRRVGRRVDRLLLGVGRHPVGRVDVGERAKHLPLAVNRLLAAEQRRLGTAAVVRDRRVERGRERLQLRDAGGRRDGILERAQRRFAARDLRA